MLGSFNLQHSTKAQVNLDRNLDSVQKITAVIAALEIGKLKIRPEDEVWARELLAAPKGLTGLVDISKLTPETVAIARATALSLTYQSQIQHETEKTKTLSPQDAQCELFRLYEMLFVALTDRPSKNIDSLEDIRWRMIDRAKYYPSKFQEDLNAAADELTQFYDKNAADMFALAKSLGGVKVVSGGQRAFGPSALAATRISGLYCDTQLIPDPVFPFFAADLRLNARHLQLAHVLFYILPLRPLIEARLPESPIVVFPSFEQNLEEHDAITQLGLESLTLSLVGPVCNAKISSLAELSEFAKRHEDSFLTAVMQARLFVPPNADPDKEMSWQDAVATYLGELKGVRDQQLLEVMKKVPPGTLILNGIIERLRPQYHLLENAEELNAQPLLSQPVHWHYFERCASTNASELVNKKVLSEQAFSMLRALQDDSLSWLGNIPIEGLVSLRQNMEHAFLREELKKYTAQLASADSTQLDEVVREVNHGLQALIQRQKKAIRDIEDKYAPKKWAAAVGALGGGLTGATMFFMPALAATAGVNAPIASVVGALATGGLAALKEMAGEVWEKRRAGKTMLGMLAVARSKS